MRFAILGPLDVRHPDGSPVVVGGPKVRALLRRLLLEAGRVVSVDVLVEELYGTDPPADAANALQSQVSRLRRALPGLVEFHPAGYRLVVGPDDVDVHRFERLAARAGTRSRDGDAVLADTVLAGGRSRCGAASRRCRRAAGELRLDVLEDRAAARLALGQADELVAELRAHVAAHPLRERLRALLMRALHRRGRQRRGARGVRGRPPAAGRGARRGPVAGAGATSTWPCCVPRGRGRPACRPADQLRRPGGRVALLGGMLGKSRLVTLIGPGGAGQDPAGGRGGRRAAGRRLLRGAGAGHRRRRGAQAVLDALGLREDGTGCGAHRHAARRPAGHGAGRAGRAAGAGQLRARGGRGCRGWSAGCSRPARGCGCWRPAGRRSASPARRSARCRRCAVPPAGTRPAAAAGLPGGAAVRRPGGRGAPGLLRRRRRTSARAAICRGAGRAAAGHRTGRGAAAVAAGRARSPRGWTTGSGCCRAAAAPRCPGTGRCARSSSGAGTCWTSRSGGSRGG